MAVRVLLVDDEATSRRMLATELVAAGFEVSEASDGREGLGLFRDLDPDIVVTDKNMPNKTGIELLEAIRERSDAPVIVLTAYGSVESAVNAMKGGALDYVASDTVELSEIVDLVREAVGRVSKGDIEAMTKAAFPGSSPLASRLRRRMKVFAPLASPVFIQGAAGTRRAEIARVLHRTGSSGEGSLLEVPASEIRPQMLRSEAAAIFIEDIEDLPRTLQPACVEALEADRAPRLLLSSTVALADTGLGRELLEKLAPFVIDVPLLGDHPIDLPAIVEHSLADIGAILEREGLELSPRALARLQSERWPGNEAELHDVLHRAVILSPGRRVEIDSIEHALDEALASVARIRKLKRSRERDRLVAALRQADGVVSQASRILGLNRSAVYRLMDKYGLERERRS